MDNSFIYLLSVGALSVWAIAATARAMTKDGYHAVPARGSDEGFDHRLE
jgi:hypothetical protein